MSAHSTRSGSPGGASSVAVSLAAIGSVLAASSCCLPLFPFMMAAGLAGTSAFPFTSATVSVGRLDPVYCFGVLSPRHAKKLPTSNERNLIGPLWVSAAFVFVSIFFPQIMANLMAGFGIAVTT